MAETILLVEDEEKLARMVELELRYEGYEVEKAFDGRTGLERALSGSFDLVLLDIMLPQLSGMEVLRRLRRERSTPVIMLTARDSVIDKVSGLDSGADDYITKPFAIEELLARIRAALRKRTTAPEETLLTAGPLTMNVDKLDNELEIWRREQPITAIPMLLLTVILIFFFWIALPLMLLGLFFGFRYQVTGPDLEDDALNGVMGSVADTAADVGRQVMDELRSQHEKSGGRKK